MKNWHIFIIFATLVIFLRIPFISEYLYFPDSVIYALGMEKFDLTRDAPSAPGCIGYAAMGKFFNNFTKDTNRSLVFIGMLFSSLGCGVTYILGKEIFGKKAGMGASLLFLTSPLIWYFGEIAMPVTCNLFFSTLVAFFSYMAYTRKRLIYIVASAVSLGIGASFRQDILIFMLPLWIFAAMRKPLRNALPGLVVFLISCLIWIVPSSASAGGFFPYLNLCKERISGGGGHASYMTFSNIFEKKMHINNYLFTLITALFLGFIPFAWNLGRIFNPKAIIRDKRIKFLIVWILPSFIYMNLVGGGRGYSFSHIAAIFICAGLALEIIRSDFSDAGFPRLGENVLIILIIAITGVNIFFFLYDPHPLDTWLGNSWFRSADIRKHDEMLKIKLEYIKDNYPVDDSIIFVGAPKQTFWHVFYYLPSYRVYQPSGVYWKGTFMEMAYRHERTILDGPLLQIPQDIKNIIFFDEDLYPHIRAKRKIEKIALDKNHFLYAVRPGAQKNIKLEPGCLEVF